MFLEKYLPVTFMKLEKTAATNGTGWVYGSTVHKIHICINVCTLVSKYHRLRMQILPSLSC